MSIDEMEDLAESFALLWATDASAATMTVMRHTAMTAIDSFHAFNVAVRARTIGIMLVESTNQMQAAVSGWATWMYNVATLPQISQADALGKVVRLADLIGHQLEASDRDQGQAGHYHVCHCEKQLVADHFFGDSLGKIVKIVISREPCRDCWNFLARLELIIGLHVNIYVNDELSFQGRDTALFREWLGMFGELLQV